LENGFFNENGSEKNDRVAVVQACDIDGSAVPEAVLQAAVPSLLAHAEYIDEARADFGDGEDDAAEVCFGEGPCLCLRASRSLIARRAAWRAVREAERRLPAEVYFDEDEWQRIREQAVADGASGRGPSAYSAL
jgi:hypothetical protein